MKLTKVLPPISFKYKSVLKDEWLQNPEMQEHVTKGIYGGDLTKNSISLEHLKPHSKGGKNELDNFALATKNNNQKRSSNPLNQFLNKEMVDDYCNQFKGWCAKLFNNEEYIKGIKQTIKQEGVEL